MVKYVIVDSVRECTPGSGSLFCIMYISSGVHLVVQCDGVYLHVDNDIGTVSLSMPVHFNVII